MNTNNSSANIFDGHRRLDDLHAEYEQRALVPRTPDHLPLRPRLDPADQRGGLFGNQPKYSPDVARFNGRIVRTHHAAIANDYGLRVLAALERRALLSAVALVSEEERIVAATPAGSLTEKVALDLMFDSIERLKTCIAQNQGQLLEAMRDA